MDICELLPLHAKIANKLAIVRNMRFAPTIGHGAMELFTGLYLPTCNTVEPRPEFGSVLSRLRANNGNGVLPYIQLTRFEGGVGKYAGFGAAYLGTAHDPFMPVPGAAATANLGLHPSVTLDRLADRKALLESFDTLGRDLDKNDNQGGMDAITRQALEIIRCNQVRDAFDISKEPQSIRAKYGPHTQLLQARRLAEAGVSVLTLSFPGGLAWDHHGKEMAGPVFLGLRKLLPALDQAVSALVTDLYEKGLEKDVAVVVAGEMGRDPRINQGAGRNHWNALGFALVAGGGFEMGQVIGATDARAARAIGRHYTPQTLLATLYAHFGIDTQTMLTDLTGRPHPLLEDHGKIEELL
jgi:hypothetical protein